MTIQVAGQELVESAVLAGVHTLDVVAGDRLVVTLGPSPDFQGRAVLAASPTGFLARDIFGQVLFRGRIPDDMRLTSGFVERGAQVRVTELEVIVE